MNQSPMHHESHKTYSTSEWNKAQHMLTPHHSWSTVLRFFNNVEQNLRMDF